MRFASVDLCHHRVIGPLRGAHCDGRQHVWLIQRHNVPVGRIGQAVGQVGVMVTGPAGVVVRELQLEGEWLERFFRIDPHHLLDEKDAVGVPAMGEGRVAEVATQPGMVGELG